MDVNYQEVNELFFHHKIFIQESWAEKLFFQRRNVYPLVAKIEEHKNVVGISAEMTAVKRYSSMQSFQNGEANVLVCTDSCSRALNLNVNLVINFDVPMVKGKRFDPKIYTYRVSRTGRFGKSGVAVLLNDGCETVIKHRLMRNHGIEMTVIWMNFNKSYMTNMFPWYYNVV